jgi:hypothetical protein
MLTTQVLLRNEGSAYRAKSARNEGGKGEVAFVRAQRLRYVRT